MHVISVLCLLDAFNCMKATGSLRGGIGVEFTHSLPGPTNTLSLLALCPPPQSMSSEFSKKEAER